MATKSKAPAKSKPEAKGKPKAPAKGKGKPEAKPVDPAVSRVLDPGHGKRDGFAASPEGKAEAPVATASAPRVDLVVDLAALRLDRLRLDRARVAAESLSHESRSLILEALREAGGELAVETITARLKAFSQPAVSHHLSLMRTAGIVRFRRDGKYNRYSLVPEAFADAAALMLDFARSSASVAPAV